MSVAAVLCILMGGLEDGSDYMRRSVWQLCMSALSAIFHREELLATVC